MDTENGEVSYSEIRKIINEVDIDAKMDGTLAHLLNEKSIASMVGFSNDELEAVYTLAYNFHQQKHYEKAIPLYNFLVLYCHTEVRYWMGQACCLHVSKKYDMAVCAYVSASILDPLNPIYAFHSGECLLSLGLWGEAKEAFKSSLFLATNESFKGFVPECKNVGNRAKAFLQIIEKNLVDKPEEKGN